MFKKILVTLLTVLCTFTVFGMNVSAAQGVAARDYVIKEVNVYEGEYPRILVEDKIPEYNGSDYEDENKTKIDFNNENMALAQEAYGTKGEVLDAGEVKKDPEVMPAREYISNGLRPLTYGDFFDGYAEYFLATTTDSGYYWDSNEIVNFDYVDPDELLVAGQLYYVFLNRPTWPDFYDATDVFNGGISHYYKKVGDGKYEKVESETDETLYCSTFYFYATKKIENIVVTGFPDGAGDYMFSKRLNFNHDSLMSNGIYYYDADKFEAATSDTERKGALLSSEGTLEKGKRYHAELKISVERDYGTYDTKYDFYPTNDVVVTINGKKATDAHNYWDDLDDYGVIVYSIDFVANEKVKETNLLYSIPETYEWVITATVEQENENNLVDIVNKVLNVGKDYNTDGDVRINVKVNNWSISKNNTLKVSVESKNDWCMVDESGSNSLGYNIYSIDSDSNEITEETWTDNNDLISLTGIGGEDNNKAKSNLLKKSFANVNYCSGIFRWVQDPQYAGIYKDTLTFVAEITNDNAENVEETNNDSSNTAHAAPIDKR